MSIAADAKKRGEKESLGQSGGCEEERGERITRWWKRFFVILVERLLVLAFLERG
jgi:hypothetical protein